MFSRAKETSVSILESVCNRYSPLSDIFITFYNSTSKEVCLYCSTFTQSKTSASAVVVCATVTRTSATFRTPTCQRNWSAGANTIPADLSAQHVARVSNRKNGDNPLRRRNLYANVKIIAFLVLKRKVS